MKCFLGTKIRDKLSRQQDHQQGQRFGVSKKPETFVARSWD